MKGRGVKLFAGSKVIKDGVATSAHWVCASAWMSFEAHALENKLSTTGADGMAAFYTFVNDPQNNACSFTLVVQRMDEVHARPRTRAPTHAHPHARPRNARPPRTRAPVTRASARAPP
eukprot:4472915-Prymnesium_polylepis.1